MHLLLLALLIAPTLGPAPTPVSARPRTLADVAAERRLGIKPPGSGTFSVAGAEGMPVLLPVAYTAPELLPIVTTHESVVGYPYYIGVGGTRTVIVHEHHGHAAPSAASHSTPHAAPHASSGRKR